MIEFLYTFLFGGTFISTVYYLANTIKNPVLAALIGFLPINICCCYIMKTRDILKNYMKYGFFVGLITVILVISGYFILENTNIEIENCMKEGLKKSGLPENSIQLLKNQDRSLVSELIKMEEFIDLIIPRGGKSLIKVISNDSKVPVLKHYEGLCHVYLDDQADITKALKISLNAKIYRYGICGAMETLLVSKKISNKILPELKENFDNHNVELRGCGLTQKIIEVKTASTEDWKTEYLEPILSIKIVENVNEAIQHINKFGSGHTDCIVTEDDSAKNKFLKEVDSSSVMHNLPTCFADGFEYGLGAEVGISTDKLHARGPVGLEGLTSQKFIIEGSGQLRS